MMLPTSRTPPKKNLNDLTVCILGGPGIGKSTFASKLDTVGKTCFLATEPGLGSLDVYQEPINSWDEFLNICREIQFGKHDFETFVIDTGNNLYRFLEQKICDTHGGLESISDFKQVGKGWILARNEFYRVLRKFAATEYGLWIITHSMDKKIESPTGDYDRAVPDFPGKLVTQIAAMMDMILYFDVRTVPSSDGKSKRHERIIRTEPAKRWVAKDRTGKLPAVLPLDFDVFSKYFNAKNNGKG